MSTNSISLLPLGKFGILSSPHLILIKIPRIVNTSLNYKIKISTYTGYFMCGYNMNIGVFPYRILKDTIDNRLLYAQYNIRYLIKLSDKKLIKNFIIYSNL